MLREYQNGLQGWRPDYKVIESFCQSLGQYSELYKGASHLKGSGRGKIALLHENYAKIVDADLNSHLQGIGDCVSHGWGLGVDVLAATEIVAGEREKFIAKVATEILYGMSRVEIGRGELGRGDGSQGAWAAEAVRDLGTLHRLPYLDGKYDFTEYDSSLAKTFGMPGRGCPNELEPIAREHPVKTVSMVTTYEEARDAIANGYPIPVCSNYGFKEVRDKDGFARASGRWSHCMLFCAVDDEYKRPGLLCWNSWGDDWIRGPKRHGQPDGSFWVDADTVDYMLSSGESYAISGYEGFKTQDIDYDLF